MDEFALQLREIVKTYPGGVRALDGVDLAIRPRELHALCGENGAGKTTLAAIAAARLQATRGRVTATGAVGFVPQHPQLMERMRVWENVVIGREPRRGLRLDAAAARELVRNLSARFALPVEPDAWIESLDAGAAQRVEILRELARDPAVLILDEPTAALAPGDSVALFAPLQTLAAGGTAILIVTHDLGDIADYAERITVLRAGRVAARFKRGASAREIARAMVGGELPALAARTISPTAPCFEARGLSAGAGADALHDFDLDVRTGEIVGIAGVEGNGQRTLVNALAGLAIVDRGTMTLAGHDVTRAPLIDRRAHGMRIIPFERNVEGLSLTSPLWQNWSARGLAAGRMLRAIDPRRLRGATRSAFERWGVRFGSVDHPAGSLSGGNAQKVILAREIDDEATLIVAAQPTRGLDIAAMAFVWNALRDARARGGRDGAPSPCDRVRPRRELGAAAEGARGDPAPLSRREGGLALS